MMEGSQDAGNVVMGFGLDVPLDEFFTPRPQG